MTSLDYRVNVSASSPARKRSSIIGLVLPNLSNAFFEQIAACLGRAAAQRSLALFVTVGSDQPEDLLGEHAVALVRRRAGLTPDDGPDTGSEAHSVILKPQPITRTSSLGR